MAGNYLRVEVICDRQGFWLEPHKDIKEKLKANVQEAADRGAFGAPTFFVDGEMFWGQDRLDFVEEKLAARGAA